LLAEIADCDVIDIQVSAARFSDPADASTLTEISLFKYSKILINTGQFDNVYSNRGIGIGSKNQYRIPTSRLIDLSISLFGQNTPWEKSPATKIQAELVCGCFLEVCRAVGYLAVGFDENTMFARTTSFEVEYLISHLFGLATDTICMSKTIWWIVPVRPYGTGSARRCWIGVWGGKMTVRNNLIMELTAHDDPDSQESEKHRLSM
jgi:hypothetical protein